LDDSNLFDSEMLHARLKSYTPSERQEPHAHDQSSISILLGGSLVERVGRTTRRGALGAIIIKPAGVLHENKYGGSGTVILTLTGAYVEGLAEQAWEWRTAGPALAHAMISIKQARAGHAIACEEALYCMLSELRGFVTGSEPARVPPSWLTEAISLAGLEDGPTRIMDIAKQVDVHPVHLTRVFRKHFGRSLSGYMRRKKVVRAAALLRSSRQRVCDVAAELEFFDQSHLCRAFKAECGVSPAEYQSLVR
jgi:AraC family transcriptional regulator